MGGIHVSEVLVHVSRGEEVECIHRGDLVVVNLEGDILYSVGDPHKETYWRSAAKPFQVLPLIEAGGIDKYGFTGEELALMSSSHGGEERHVNIVKEIFKKLNSKVDLLDCGIASPMNINAARDVIRGGGNFQHVHNACSGKHSAMIALALLKGFPVKNYIKLEHPVQQEILDVIADVTEFKREEIKIGVDGCGVPVFHMPIYNMALAYAKLSKPDGVEPESRKEALRIVGDAMTKNPYFVAGTGRLDTLLMEVTKGRLVAKLGAEAVYCVGVMDKGIGIVFKIEDGNYRAIDPVIVELLRRLDFISTEEYEKLKDQWEVKIRNHRKEVIGTIKAVF